MAVTALPGGAPGQQMPSSLAPPTPPLAPPTLRSSTGGRWPASAEGPAGGGEGVKRRRGCSFIHSSRESANSSSGALLTHPPTYRHHRSPLPAMATKIDKDNCREAYNLVRDDNNSVSWVTFRYDGSTIVPGDQGSDYEDFVRTCTDDIRQFAYIRITTGDAMSKRAKFALVTWIGEDIGGLQRAKIGTDKTLVKEVVQSFAKELMITERRELEESFIREELKKAGGANYDAQTE